MELAILIAVVVVAVGFDFTNGFHDAANAIATSVSTRALTPRIALTLAAVMNFIGALLGQKVAHTVSDTISTDGFTVVHGLTVVLCGLLGAITWNLITWWFGLPSSSSHALIGGLVGSALAAGALVHWATIVDKVLIPMVLSPLAGFTLAFLLMLAFMWILRRRNPHKVSRTFRMLQTVSAAAMALGHGLQDAQKTMGVIFLALAHDGPRLTRRSAAALGRAARSRRHLGRHVRRWLADHEDPRPQDHRPRPGARVRRGDRGCHGALHDGVRLRGTHLDDPHHHVGDHGRRRHPPPLGRALGRGPHDPGRLGADLPGGRPAAAICYAVAHPFLP